MSSVLFINAKVWQPDGSFNEAFGIAGTQFDFVGSNIEAGALKSSYDNITDLKGKLVLPGLIDGHLHLVNGSLMRTRFDASSIADIQTLKSKIFSYAKLNPGQNWIIGGNLDLNTIINHADLSKGNFTDEIYTDKPIYLANYDCHSALCNTKALQASGLLNNTDEFSDEEVLKDNNGNPNGLLKEKAMDFVFDNLPQPQLDEKINAVEDFMSLLHFYGITTVTDITLIPDLEVYRKLYELGKLKIRINSYIPFEEFTNLGKHKEYTKEINPDLYSINGFKEYWDGALSSETALFSENYLGKKYNGYRTELVENGEISKMAKDINDAGMQMIIHAIGDKAVSEVLDLYETLCDPSKETRHRIEHAQHISDNDFERFKKYSIIASVQPLHLKYDAKTVKEKLPAGLVNNTHNYKRLIDMEAMVNFGTDFPIVEVNPFENIRLAVTRKTKDGVFTPEHTIDLNNCLKCYTINNAYSNFNEKAIGSIAAAKAADFVIMNNDLFEMEPDNISNARVWKTYFDGAEVYSML